MQSAISRVDTSCAQCAFCVVQPLQLHLSQYWAEHFMCLHWSLPLLRHVTPFIISAAHSNNYITHCAVFPRYCIHTRSRPRWHSVQWAELLYESLVVPASGQWIRGIKYGIKFVFWCQIWAKSENSFVQLVHTLFVSDFLSIEYWLTSIM